MWILSPSWCLFKWRYALSIGSEQYPVRKAPDMYQDMEQAVQSGETVRGVKDVFPLINLPFFDIAQEFVPDYMHCVLLGVTKQFSKLWLESFGMEYNIGSPQVLHLINSRLAKINLRQYISRLPRSLNEQKHWKGAEWRCWLLFYAVPCLKDILP